MELLGGDLVDLDLKDWQEVEIPLEAFELTEPIEGIGLFGNLEGTFFLDDIRLVTARAITSVLEEHIAGRPQGFTLEQNFPNPFNSGTVIRFSLPSSDVVKLVVYNVTGQKMATLLEGIREAGRYTVFWDGREISGNALATGIYLYRLQAGSQMETRKLLLLR